MSKSRINIPGYRIIRHIGSGGMSEVYLAEQESLKREVAIKVLHSRTNDDPKTLNRFLHEAETIAKLYHPNIVSIYEVGKLTDEVIFYSMPYLPNGDLSDFNYENETQLINLMLTITEGLNYAHQQGVVHRDIKPENILFDQFGQVQIADFGIAISQNSQRLTKEDHIVGSATYMSPEQAQSKVVDARTDIYSLGVLLFELIAGAPPFKRNDDLATLMAHVNEPVPELPKSVGHWQDILNRCLEKDPEDRFQSIADLQLALNQMHSEHAQPSIPYKNDESKKSIRTLMAVTALGVVAFSLFIISKDITTKEKEAQENTDFFSLERQNTIEQKPTVPELEIIQAPEITIEQANLLVEEAAERIEDFKLTSPPEDNALERYITVLTSYPEHEQAQQGIYAITLKYFELIGDKVSTGNYTQASGFVDIVLETWKKTGLNLENFAGETSLLLNTMTVQFNKEKKAFNKSGAESILQLAEHLTGNNQTIESFKKQLDTMPELGATVVGPDGIISIIIPAQIKTAGSSTYQGPDFAITKYEITQAQYAKFAQATQRENSRCRHMAARGLSFSSKTWKKPGIPQQSDHPAVCVSWSDAQAYARWLSEKTGQTYRLPKRDELNYLRAIKPQTNISACRKGNIAGQEARQLDIIGDLYNCDDNYRFTSPVGRFQANALSINDLFGNVREWTINCSKGEKDSGFFDKMLSNDDACDHREALGESWRDGKQKSKMDVDEKYPKADNGYTHIGIRLVLEL